MSAQDTPETDNDTQFELAAWELLKEARQELEEYKASAQRARELARQLLDAFERFHAFPNCSRARLLAQEALTKAKEVMP
jgi:hypothetical protein